MAWEEEQSVAEKEPIRITFKPATGGAQEEEELPLRLLVVGDFTGRKDTTPVEKRETAEINKNNFDEVLERKDVTLDFQVKNVLSGGEDDLRIRMPIHGMRDFEPDAIVQQVPELRQIMRIREALTELRGPLARDSELGRKIEELFDLLVEAQKDGLESLEDIEVAQ